MTTPPVVHARAPLRISLAGGGTDVPPYPSLHGGAVLSCTISLYAYATVRPCEGRPGTVECPDLDTAVALSGRRRLAHSVLAASGRHADVVLACDAPPGSGLGSSSSLVVALCAAMANVSDRVMTSYELAEQAVRIERDELGIPGGMQDQYAAAFGGFNFIEFGGDGVLVDPLRLPTDVAEELQGSLLLLPTPVVSRRSRGILRRQIAAYHRKDPDVMSALELIKRQAVAAKNAVLRGDMAALAELLDAGWRAKRRLAAGVATDDIDALYDEAIALGALGGKLLGAGGGGYLLVLVPFATRGHVSRELRARGYDPMQVSFTEGGTQVWHALA